MEVVKYAKDCHNVLFVNLVLVLYPEAVQNHLTFTKTFV